MKNLSLLLCEIFLAFILFLGGSQNSYSQACGSFSKIAKGYAASHTVAIKADGTLWAWGSNSNGQLGDGTNTDKLLPIKIGTATNWATIAIGANYTVGIKTDGTLWAWGSNSNGQLGDGTTVDKNTPVQIGVATNWSKITCGDVHTAAIKTDGTLWVWGSNSSYQLGDAILANKTTPAQVGTLTTWANVSAGYAHTMAIKTNGTLWGTGQNTSGELGDGTTVAKSTFTQIGTVTTWATVNASYYYTAATRTNGTLWGWGYNFRGQLGDGTTVDKTSPVQIGTATNWTAYAAGLGHMVAQQSNGTLWVWGTNAWGNFGNGTFTSSYVPIQVGTLTSWSAQLNATTYFNAAIKADGSIWTNGFNSKGQIGDGTVAYKSSFVQISYPDPVAPAAAAQSFCGSTTVSGLVPAPSATIKWYNVASGGTALAGTTAIAATGTYYAAAVNTAGCESNRTPAVVTINAIPAAPTAAATLYYAQNATAAALTATGSNLLWYTVATGGTGSSTAPTPSTSALGTTSYWVSQTVSGCEGPRTKIDVIVALPATHLNFNGVDDYVSVGNILTPSYTKEAWIFISNGGISNNFISGGDVDGQHALWAPAGFGNRLSSGHNGVWDAVQDPAPLSLNTWYHVAVTYDAASTTMKLYKNGVLVSVNTAVPAYISGTMVRLGAHNAAENLFQGNMDEVRIWNNAQSADDILRRMNCELQGTEPGLIAYYKFNQGIAAGSNPSVTTLTDATANANNGTLTNFSLTGTTSNWVAGSPVTTGSSIPAAPTVTTPVYYAQAATAAALTATGTSLQWYSTATGGTGSSTAPTPSTATVGTTSYWVASSNVNGCQSARTKIDVVVKSTATHLNFDGTNDAIALSATGFPLGNSARTIEAFIRTTQNNGGGAIMTYGNLAANSRFALYQTNGKLNFVAEGNDYNTNVTINDGLWHHVAATHDGTTLRVYIDGVLAGSTAKTFATAGTAFSIGYRGVSAEFFQGDIDEVRVWNTVRTAAQLGSNCPLIGNETGLLAYYRFDQGFPAGNNSTVTTLQDATANNNNGVLSGFTLSGNTSNWLMVSPLPTGPDVTETVNYCLNSPATALAAPGTGLLWYTTRFGGTGSSTAPIPVTNTAGTISYWVTQPTTGCGESPRSKINVVVNANPLTVAAANKTQTLAVSGSTVFANNCLDLIASVNPNGAAPVSGNTTAKVWIEATQPSTPGAQFVKRHYEITPATNAATATARVTLYFTQPEFDAFNAISTVDLPTGPADAAGKANLLIEKRSGTSSDGTGLPSTYTGAVTTLNPVDADIVWNSAQSRWEINFDVSGFSGFFVKTTNGVLPLNLLSFNGSKLNNNDILLQWQTTHETNSNRFEIEISNNGSSFVKLGVVAAKNTAGVNNYDYTDNSTWASDTRYYRLKIIDNYSRFYYSTVIKMNTKKMDDISIYPNPVKDAFVLNTNNSLLNTTVKITDMSGSTIMVFTVNSRYQNIDISHFAKGIYMLRFADGASLKLIKQ